MAHAAEYLRLQPGRKVLVLVTDGADTVSDLSYDETLRRIIAADCQVYAVQTGIIENANLYDLMAVRRLEVFSDRTGGAVYIPKNTNDLDAAFTQIAADLAQQYVLSYYPTMRGATGVSAPSICASRRAQSARAGATRLLPAPQQQRAATFRSARTLR
jgi:VWFA-related protein